MLVRFLECTDQACGFRFPATERDRALLDEDRCPRCGQDTVATTTYLQEPYNLTPSATDVVHSPIIETVIDNVRSIHNVGSIFRSADGAGVQHLHLCGITPSPEHPKLAKTALGAQDTLLWTHHNNSIAAVKTLRARGFRLWALEEAGAVAALPRQASARTMKTVSLFDLDNYADEKDEPAISPIALIIGNEVAGVDPDLLTLCDRILYVPMTGQKRSLNVAVAYGIAVFWLRKYLAVNRKNRATFCP